MLGIDDKRWSYHSLQDDNCDIKATESQAFVPETGSRQNMSQHRLIIEAQSDGTKLFKAVRL